MVFTSGITVDAVRRALNNVPASVISDATVQQAIDRAEVIVGDEAESSASAAAKRVAVIDTAAHRTVISTSASFTEMKEALDLRAEVNVQTWIASLREDMEESLERISGSNKSTLYTLGDRRRRSR